MPSLPPKPVSASRVDGHVYKVFPNDLNSHYTIFGGLVMATCDRVALVVAERHSQRLSVTASVDSVQFMAPAKEGDTLLVHAACNRTWHSSMEIGVRVVAQDAFRGTERHIVSAYLTFVALGEDNKPTAVPPLLPETDVERRRYAEADMRRNARLAHAKALRDFRSRG